MPDDKIYDISGTGAFIHAFIKEDLQNETQRLVTRFPPEPNGYLHIGHAKSICFNYALAEYYGGKFNLRFDDTNPAKEDNEFVKSIIKDMEWLGCDLGERIYFASDYFGKLYEYAVLLIKKGKAFVCDFTADEVKSHRGTLTQPGKESPNRNRSVEENLDLFERMKNGEFADGAKTLRAKIDMASSNINMRDPVIYRIARIPHYRTGSDWIIYPMYDYAHPVEDAIEGITHSICSLEFEDHRPFYDWVVNEIGFEVKPRQIEFAKLFLTNSVMGKRYNKELVSNKTVDGWDDPRLVTLSGLRRRGYTPEAIKRFLNKIGFSKSDNRVDYGLLEYCVREDIKAKAKVVMAVIDPLKIVITNYEQGKTEMLEVVNNPETPEMGIRSIPFSRELFIERSDFMEDAPKNFFRLSVGKEVRLFGAYYITCTDVIKNENGVITELRCTYDPETKSGSGFTGRKVKGTIHWVSCAESLKVNAMLYDNLVFDDETNETGVKLNENSCIKMENCRIEPSVKQASLNDRFQFMRNGYFCLDSKTSSPENLVFNRITVLKSSYVPETKA